MIASVNPGEEPRKPAPAHQPGMPVPAGLQKVCAWCGVQLEGSDSTSEQVSHGICEQCAHENLKKDTLI